MLDSLVAWFVENQRPLPWRVSYDPYHVWVSEVMLQQTQVPRVINRYKSFIKKFPTARTLAKASLSAVLKEWSGLGYNRRAKYLHDAAKRIIDEYHGDVAVALHHPLQGVGPYTRAAVKVFALNEPDVLLETNIRTVFIHHFFPRRESVADQELMPWVIEAAKGQDPRTWHWALMDYGVHLKKLHGNPSRKSAHHAKQSRFEGSLRQVRGAILRELHVRPRSEASLVSLIRPNKGYLKKALASLARDGLITKQKGKWQIA